jgi:hypothetical protein
VVLKVKAGSRTLSVEGDSTLAALHALLSPASSELHEFVVAGGRVYGDPDADDQLVGRKVVDDREIVVSELAGKKVEYRCGGTSTAIRIPRIL